MPILLRTETTIEFNDMETLEQFVKQLPWAPHQHVAVVEGNEYEEKDEVDFNGQKLPATHKFKALGVNN